MNKIISIDLGTTSSCVTVMEGGKSTVIASAEGVRTTPPVVTFTKTGERLIDESAERRAVTNTNKIISSIKRHMGADYRVDINGRKYTPQEIPAMILQKLKADAEAYLGETMAETVITVPAYFNDTQHQVTEDAGKVVGLDVKRIINEPTAVALACGLDNEKGQKIIVYDLGGGTFDVSIIEIGDGVIGILSTNGDTCLGGDNFGNAITNWMIVEFKKAEDVDLSGDKTAPQRLKEVAEKAKKEMSTATTIDTDLPFITATSEGPKHLDMNLTRTKFDELAYNLIECITIPVQNVLKDVGITASEFGKVLLIGDPTRMIAVQEKVKQFTGKELSKSSNPDECVAIGAATQDGKLADDADTGDIFFLDVTPLFLSIETIGDVATRLIERSITILTRKGQVFSTAVGNQTAVDIYVVQGECQLARDNRTLGQFHLDGISSARRGILQIEVAFDIDANDIVNASVKDLGIGEKQHTTIASGSNMSGDNIDKAVKKATEYGIQDKKRKETIGTRDDADSIVFQTGKALEETGDRVSPNDKAGVEADLNSLKEAINHAPVEGMTDTQIEDIESGKEKLMNSTQKLSAKVYERARAVGVTGAGPNMGGTGASPAPNDDVVNADFKEV